MQGRPVVLILEVCSSTVKDKGLCNVVALLRVLAEEVHHEMQHSLAIVVRLVDISAFLDECLDEPYLKLDYSQVQWRPKNASTQVHIDCIFFHQDLRCFKVLLPDGQT